MVVDYRAVAPEAEKAGAVAAVVDACTEVAEQVDGVVEV